MKKVIKIKTATVPRLCIPKKYPSQEWFVTLSHLYPEIGKMKVFKVYEGFYQCKSHKERLAYGQRLVNLLKGKLPNGLNLFNQPALHRLVEVAPSNFDDSLAHQLKTALDGRRAGLRPKTFSGYTAAMNGFIEWLKSKNLEKMLVVEFTRDYARTFFDFLQLEPRREYKTCNKYLTMLKMFFVRLHKKGLCLYNPFDRITLGSGEKLAFDELQRNELKEVLFSKAPQLWLFVQFMFYTFVRPKELRFARVGDIPGNKLQMKGLFSKNKKTQHATFPPKFMQVIAKTVIKNYPPAHYIYKKEGRPSPEHWSTNHFYRQHQPFIDGLGYGKQHSLYSWKHTSIMCAYQNGVDICSLMGQCRHRDLVVCHR